MAYTSRWAHKSGEVRAAFERVQREHPNAWAKVQTPHDDKEFIRLVGALSHATIPECGLNGKRGNAADLSKDVLAFPNATGCRDDRPNGFPGLELVDIIVAHETTSAKWGWTDVTQATIDGGASGEWVQPGVYPGGGTSHKTSLGASLFWGLGGLRENWPELKVQLREYADAKVDFVRTLIHLRAGVDGWDRIGTHAEDSGLDDLLKRYLDLVGSYGMKVEYTLLGGIKDMETVAQQDRFVDRYANAISGRMSLVALTEIMNEYGVNGGDTAMLRRMARRLRGLVASSHIIALSSPNGTHGGASKAAVWAEVQKMYDGLPEANAITPHWNRAINAPPDLGPSCPAIVICGEPRGPSSSVHETDRPADIAADYQAAITAKYAAYVLHSDSGVWSTYIIDRHKTPDRGQWPTFSTHKNGQAILDAVRQIRLTGTWSGGTGPVEPTDPTEPDMPRYLYPDEHTYWADYEAQAVALYKRAFDEGKRGSPDLDPDAFRWFTRPAFDIGAGNLDPEAAKKGHLNALREALGLAA